MKFTIFKDILLKGIQSVQSVIDVKASQLILSHILIEAMEDTVILTATDFNIGMISTIQVKPVIQGAVTIPAKKFLEIIRELPDNEPIMISAKKNNLVVIECVNNVFKIMGLPEDEFSKPPVAKEKNHLILKQSDLKIMIKRTKFAVGNDDIRRVLNGILFLIKTTSLKMVATDGRSLAVVDEKREFPKTMEGKFILPIKAVNELDKILNEKDDIKLFITDKQVLFDAGNIKLISRLIEGEFPNYERVIPEESKEKISINREQFLSGIKRVALFASPESMFIKIEAAKDKVVLLKNDPHMGEARVDLNAIYKGKDISIGFNPEYLVNLLKNIDEENINLEITDPEKPGVVRIGEEYIYVVMPRQSN